MSQDKVKESNSEIEVRDSDISVSNSPIAMLKAAKEAGIEPKDIQGFLDVQINWEANEAKKAYVKAMTEFKANPPKIIKDKAVSFGAGKASYKHASLAKVCESVNAGLSNHGLSASWSTIQEESGGISVICKITHRLGHSECTKLTANADTSGSKNSIQAIGSTITYLQRYTLLSLVGLATEDQDNDAVNVGVKTITEAQVSTLRDYLADVEIDESRLLKWAKIESIEDLPLSKYEDAIRAVKKVKDGVQQ